MSLGNPLTGRLVLVADLESNPPPGIVTVGGAGFRNIPTTREAAAQNTRAKVEAGLLTRESERDFLAYLWSISEARHLPCPFMEG